jgi:biopolymer transport protein ExbD
VPLFAFALFAALLLGEHRAWGGGMVRAPTARAGRPWTIDQADALLGIDRMGTYYFNRNPIRRATLAAVLDSAFRRLPAGTPLYVSADKSLSAEVVETALQIARKSGVRQVSFVADPVDNQ